MYYDNQNNENKSHDAWERSIPDNLYHYSYRSPDGGGTPPIPEKKKGGVGGKIVALSLVCALAGGLVGGGAVYALGGGRSTTTLVQGDRPATVVSMSQTSSKTILSAAQIYEAYVGSTVGITTEITINNAWGQPVSQAAAGSGFVISADGYILTNYHVIEGATTIKVAFMDGKTYDATLVGGEADNDIAVLKIEATGLTPVVIGDSDNIRVGEGVVAIGNPLGELTYSMTQGIVSAKDRNITTSDGKAMNMIQTDTAINNGNSGGPLFDMYGQVIGITSAKLSNNSASSTEAAIEGLGFAIPINDIKDMVTDIIEHGYVTGKPYLGITVQTIPQSVAQNYNIAQGAQIQSIDSEGCAAKAGAEVGDIVTAVGDTAIVSSNELIELMKDYKSGESVSLTLDRSGVIVKLDIVLDEDTPQRRAAQNKALEEAQQQQQEQQQQEQQNSIPWPFGDMSPWFY